MKSKKEIRWDIKSLFITKKSEEIIEKSVSITSAVIDYISWKKIKHVCVYESMKDEVDTIELIEYLKNNWYHIYTPQMISETKMILIDNEYEIYEDVIDLFIIPGRAFSLDGKRLWRGKWYYDHFLAQKKYKKSLKLWICFDFQIIKDIPTEQHDIHMNEIITDSL